jgi:hypothetical protein
LARHDRADPIHRCALTPGYACSSGRAFFRCRQIRLRRQLITPPQPSRQYTFYRPNFAVHRKGFDRRAIFVDSSVQQKHLRRT